MNSQTKKELQKFIQDTLQSCLNPGDNYIESTNTLMITRENIRRDGKTPISLFQAESEGLSPFEASGELKSNPPNNLTYEMRSKDLTDYGIDDTKFKPPLTPRQFYYLEAILFAIPAQYINKKDPLISHNEATSVVKSVVKKLNLHKQENCMKLINAYEHAIEQDPVIKNQRNLSNATNEYFTTDKRFYDCIEAMVKQYCIKDGNRYTKLKPNDEICQDGQSLTDTERKQLENFLKPYIELINNGNPFANVPNSNDEKVKLIATVFKNNPTYLALVQACASQMNTGGYAHTNKLIPVQKPASMLEKDATRSIEGFKPTTNASSNTMKLDNIAIMAVQRGIQMPDLCERIKQYAGILNNTNAQDDASAAIDELKHQTAVQNVRLAEANLQNVRATHSKDESKIQAANKALTESLEALARLHPSKNDSNNQPKVSTLGHAARAGTKSSNANNMTVNVQNQSEPDSSVFNTAKARDDFREYSSKKHPARIAYEKSKTSTSDPESRRINATPKQKEEASKNRDKQKNSLEDQANTIFGAAAERPNFKK